MGGYNLWNIPTGICSKNVVNNKVANNKNKIPGKDVVEHLLQTGANVHACDDGGLIPLHNACSFGHAEVVSLLLCQVSCMIK
uniref:Uncharacterized protein n=1 Tax=Hucho hucho TaxID=62062 RepID=A0A4W5M9Q4_9TELE